MTSNADNAIYATSNSICNTAEKNRAYDTASSVAIRSNCTIVDNNATNTIDTDITELLKNAKTYCDVSAVEKIKVKPDYDSIASIEITDPTTNKSRIVTAHTPPFNSVE